MFITEKAHGEASGDTGTINGFVDFVNRQPADLAYNYPDIEECALGCYARSIGKHYHDLPREVLAVGNDMAAGTPWTFGSLAQREVTKVTEFDFV